MEEDGGHLVPVPGQDSAPRSAGQAGGEVDLLSLPCAVHVLPELSVGLLQLHDALLQAEDGAPLLLQQISRRIVRCKGG